VTHAELARRVAERALRHGDFVLRSGRRSSVYLDKYRFETDPALLGPIGAALAELATASDPRPHRLAGPELGAVPLAAAAALASGIPFLIVRKAAKDYATEGLIEGVFEQGERVLVIGFELEDFLVDRAGLGDRALVVEVVGDLHELIDRLVDLPGTRVEIAERVLRVPVVRLILDDADELRDGSLELPLPDQFLGVAKCNSAIYGHSTQSAVLVQHSSTSVASRRTSSGSRSSIVSNSVGGRNDRRCTSE